MVKFENTFFGMIKDQILYIYIIIKFFFVSLINPDTPMPNTMGGRRLGGRGGVRQRFNSPSNESIPFACGPGS